MKHIDEKTKESLFDGLSLSEYLIAKKRNCQDFHRQCKIGCKEICEVANMICTIVKSMETSFPLKYDCEKAHRKLLQMPVASIRFNTGCFLTEKRIDSDYSNLKAEINNVVQEGPHKVQPVGTSKEEFSKFKNALPNRMEVERAKHLLSSTYNMSARQGANFGIYNMKKRADMVERAIVEINRIKTKCAYLAKLEQKVFLQSIGCVVTDYLSSEETDSEEENSDNENETCEKELDVVTQQKCKQFLTNAASNRTDEKQQQKDEHLLSDDWQQCEFPSTHTTGEKRHEFNKMREQSKPIIDKDFSIVLDILREVNFNWFSFVVLLESKFANQGYSEQIIDKLIDNFATQLPKLDLSEEQLHLTNESRLAYLSELKQKEARVEEIVHESSDDEVGGVKETMDEETVKRRLKLIKDKGKRRAKCEMEANGLFGKRKSIPCSNSVIARHPDIGEVIENFVKNADIGADKWRRTGVYTFSGDTKNEKKMTFKRIQEKLQEHYGEKLSYGTIVQLCVPRNKRRLASKRYKGVANVRYQRARKGFSLKYNPDAKWSRSFYKCLDQLQKDGTHILLLNRDDQAGFRLDSTFTHKNTPSLNVAGQTITTHTDFVNKHTS